MSGVQRLVAGWPVEARILDSIVSAMNDQHDPITAVLTGHGGEPVGVIEAGDLDSIASTVADQGMVILELASGRWILFILGNGWDALSDYHADLDDALAGVNSWIDDNN